MQSMRTLVAIGIFGITLTLSQSAQPQGLEMNLKVSVRNSESLDHQLELIPTQFEILRAYIAGEDPTPISFRDPNSLIDPFIRVHGPTALFMATKSEATGTIDLNPRVEITKVIDKIDVNVAPTDLVLRGSGFNVFNSWYPIQTLLLVKDLCQVDREKRAALCEVELPSIEVFDSPLDGISSIRLHIYRQAEFDQAVLEDLPSEVLKDREDFLKSKSRNLTVTNKRMQGYFLYATYHFDAGMTVVTEGTRRDKDFEVRFGLAQARGRLPLIEGQYWIEREINFAEGTQKREKAMVSFAWPKTTKKFYSVKDLSFESLPD